MQELRSDSHEDSHGDSHEDSRADVPYAASHVPDGEFYATQDPSHVSFLDDSSVDEHPSAQPATEPQAQWSGEESAGTVSQPGHLAGNPGARAGEGPERTLTAAAALAAMPVPANQDDLPLKPVDVDGVAAVMVGTAAFALVFVVLLFQRQQLQDAGHDWYLWTALAGFGLGLFGIAYTTSRRDAIATLRAADQDHADDLAAEELSTEALLVELETIEPEHPEPEYTEPANVEPEHVTTEHVTPEHVEPEYIEPQYVAPEHVAPEHVEPERVDVVLAEVEPQPEPEPTVAGSHGDGVGDSDGDGDREGDGDTSEQLGSDDPESPEVGPFGQRGRRRRSADATDEQPIADEAAALEAPPSVYTPRRGRRG